MHSQKHGQPVLTLLVMDVSFISATLLLAPVFAAAPSLTEAVVLIKPQFEAGRGNVGKGGIVRDPEVHRLAIEKVSGSITELGWQVVEVIPSPITGAEGNKEFLLYARIDNQTAGNLTIFAQRFLVRTGSSDYCHCSLTTDPIH